MRCANKTAFRLGMSVYFILILTTGALGIRRHRSAHRLAPKPNIDDLLQRLDNTLQEQRKRLERGLPTIAYRVSVPWLVLLRWAFAFSWEFSEGETGRERMKKDRENEKRK